MSKKKSYTAEEVEEIKRLAERYAATMSNWYQLRAEIDSGLLLEHLDKYRDIFEMEIKKLKRAKKLIKEYENKLLE
jgi:hypothetical protein